jgi:hypothetical protein
MTAVPQSRNGTASSSSGPTAIVDIRQIDFRNLTYVVNSKSYKLRDGYYAEDIDANSQWELGMVDGPYYGDLTGDGKDEVAFVLSYGRAQSPTVSEARVYTLQNGRPVTIATFAVADSVNCRLEHYLEIAEGMLTIEHVLAKDSRCDHNEIIQYRWNGRQFLPIGDPKRMPCRCISRTRWHKVTG